MSLTPWILSKALQSNSALNWFRPNTKLYTATAGGAMS